MKIKDLRLPIQGVEMSHLRSPCGLNGMDGQRNDNVNGKFGTIFFKGECLIVERRWANTAH